MASLSDPGSGGRSSFQQVVAAFLAAPGLPFASVLSAERIERVFVKYGELFGTGYIYSTAVVVWGFLGQVLRDGKEASCQAAVACIVAYRTWRNEATPTANTGDYCRARAKLPVAALRDLTVLVAEDLEDQAERKWLWKNRHAKLIDGFTFTMPDTPENQDEFPSPKSQKAGVGLPIARTVAIVSLATGCVMGLALGPYAGKETGESALLRQLLDSLKPGDIAVMDRYYCSFMMIALLQSKQVQVCARIHHKRHVDFRRGRRLGKCDHVLTWTKPSCPKWMDQATYESIPETLKLRELRYQVVEPGRRTKQLTIVTTFLDEEAHTKEDIADLYGFRWNIELDIRSIKQSLHLCHVRCKSPEMVRKEIWMTLLGYNLIRTTAAAAALLHDKLPRQISFTATCQYVLASWTSFAREQVAAELVAAYIRTLLRRIAECEVANRPGRLEPRVIKRRLQGYKLMQEPRDVLKARLLAGKDLR